MIKFKKTTTKVFTIFSIFLFGTLISALIASGQFTYIISGVSTNDKFLMKNYKRLLLDLYFSNDNKVVKPFLKQTYQRTQNIIFLIPPTKEIIGPIPAPTEILDLRNKPFSTRLFSEVMMVGEYYVFEYKSHDKQIFKVAIKLSNTAMKTSVLDIPMYIRAILSLIFMTFLLNLLASYYYSPLYQVIQAIEALSQGKLDTRISRQLSHCCDDLRLFGENFDNMAEQLETLFLARGEMFQHIIHELRTPLARAQMAISLLENEISTQGKKDYQVVQQQIVALSNLVDNILSLEKLKHGIQSISVKQYNINKQVKLIVDNANYESNQLKVAFTPTSNLEIKADKKLVESAIENIIRNSLFHAGKDATIVVAVSQQGNNCCISINDNGPGIEIEKLKTIFEPFIQAERKRSDGGGYGLGLAIAKKIINLHQGQITIKNRSPHGLSVTITIPMYTSNDSICPV